jgi:hypothetical protein
LEPVAVKENEAAKFRVEFEANPVPVVKWLRYTFPLKDSVEISIENDANSSTMIIRKTCVDDAGIFTCLIENPAGAPKTSTNLTVMETTVQNSNQISINNQQSSQQSQQSTMIKQENNQQSSMIQSQENNQQQSNMIEQQEESSNSTSESCQKQSFISQTHVTSKSFSKQSTSSTTQQYDILLLRVFCGSLGFE